jgi:2-polyprenyl-3-methyl-5-hydroxy-6-metoxy-1,4-benzoquinol methylase
MSATANEIEISEDFNQLKARLKTTWSAGDYDVFARFMEKDAEVFYQRLGVKPGSRLLDVGCGAGQLALIAARAGAQVTGCDIALNWLEKARIRAAAEGLDIRFDEGDAESLPYADGQFDVVTSLIGAMFAPRPDRVAAELKRVCRPGGVIAMANWTPGGFVGKMFKIVAKHIAPSGMPSPVLWGDETTVRDRFREGIAELKFAVRTYHFEYPFPPDAVVDFFRKNYGPVSLAFESLDAHGKEQLRSELASLWSAHNKSEGDTTLVDAEYLEVVAIRKPSSRRAAALANRLEEGASGLAAFAEGLSDAEWRTPISGTSGGNDARTVGVIVHHVASMYPIETGAARAIASGTAVTDVTWDVVAGINAKHASEHGGASKAETLEFLRRSSREAAAAIREFTDDELDQAAPFSLSYGAPVTAQFVIEDHALRHSWHHLWRIRKALGR